MVKKSFKASIPPAMSFISQETIDKVEGETSPNPQNPQKPEKAPDGYKINPLYIEKKSDRLQLLIQPSLKRKLKEKAQQEGTSVNDLVCSILNNALEG